MDDDVLHMLMFAWLLFQAFQNFVILRNQCKIMKRLQLDDRAGPPPGAADGMPFQGERT